MKTRFTRLTSLLLVLVLLVTALPLQASAAADTARLEKMKTLLNSVELQPQRTGYPAVDALLEEIVAPYAGSDNFTKILAAYDWAILNIDFSWAPYSQDYAPAYDCFNVIYDLEYEEGLEEAAPFEMVNRTYHALSQHEGVCYDYAAVMTLLARYIGFEAYLHTGLFTFEAGYGSGDGHHGWSEIVIGGVSYIFDPQRDYRLCGNATRDINYYYFGLTGSETWRYKPEAEVNTARDAQFLPLGTERDRLSYVSVTATASGKAEGSRSCFPGTEVTVSAVGDGFNGWFNTDGICVSADAQYTFTVEENTHLLAVFADELFHDVSKTEWYRADATEAAVRNIVSGTRPFIFDGEQTLTRAMAVTLLFRAAGEDVETKNIPFSDVAAGKWYADAVAWGNATGIVKGISADLFAPGDPVSREQFITLLMRLAEHLGLMPEPTDLTYTDVDSISPFALEPLQCAQSAGLLAGYEDGTVRPQGELTRAEGVTLLVRFLHWLETE